MLTDKSIIDILEKYKKEQNGFILNHKLLNYNIHNSGDSYLIALEMEHCRTGILLTEDNVYCMCSKDPCNRCVVNNILRDFKQLVNNS